jgi:hypothetical protein
MPNIPTLCGFLTHVPNGWMVQMNSWDSRLITSRFPRPQDLRYADGQYPDSFRISDTCPKGGRFRLTLGLRQMPTQRALTCPIRRLTGFLMRSNGSDCPTLCIPPLLQGCGEIHGPSFLLCLGIYDPDFLVVHEDIGKRARGVTLSLLPSI